MDKIISKQEPESFLLGTASEEVQLEAVKEDAYDLKYINNPYLLVRMANIWYKLINKFS